MQNHYFDQTHPLRPYTHSSPINPGSLTPYNAARGDEAPEQTVGFWPCWNGAAWEQVENHRGKQGYTYGEFTEIKELGPLPEGWSDTPPPPPPLTPEEERAALIASFMAAIQKRLDDFARTRAYDDARACVAVYLGCANATFAAEAAYMQGVIVSTWEWSNTFTNAVLLGERPLPESWEAFEAELNAAVPLAWPVPDTRITATLAG